MFLIYDTETTGLPKKNDAPLSDSDNWPRCVQLAWQIHDIDGRFIEAKEYIIKPEGYTIPFNARKIHGISTALAEEKGHDLATILKEFEADVEKASFLIGHNLAFDNNIMGAEYYRKSIDTVLMNKPVLDTQNLSRDYCQLQGGRGGGFKPAKLEELHEKLFGDKFQLAHNAAADVEATSRCFLELVRIGVIGQDLLKFENDQVQAFRQANPDTIQPVGLDIIDYDEMSTALEKANSLEQGGEKVDKASFEAAPFVHLHNFSQFSVLQSTSAINALIKKAKADNMPAIALTDKGNMFGAYNFVESLIKEGLKPIMGCEVVVSEDYKKKQFTKDSPDIRRTQVLLAKNKAGYENLMKICSIGFVQGYYAGYPRVGKEVIEEYSGDIIALTGGKGAEIPHLILNVGETQAEEAFKYWHNLFGEDFYVEIQRHGLEDDDHLNAVLLSFARKYGVKVIAANSCYYLDKSDANAHDVLICVKEGELQSTPKGRGRGYRYGLPNEEFGFKTQSEMKALFRDLPEAIINIEEIIEKVEPFRLERDILLPKFALPEGFTDQDDYLRHLTYEGAKKRYGEITTEIQERLDFELKVIKDMGFPGYFLIVQDFTSKAEEFGVMVGPGRGSAAGSAVAYCVGITNIDPIKYKLLFERFLNPERVSMPDIDIDFDDRGRDKIIDWVVDKYGFNQVAQIITYGTMAAKSALRDVGRVMDIPLPDVNEVAKSFPDHLSANLAKVLADGDVNPKLWDKLNADQREAAKQFREKAEEESQIGAMIRQAKILEGSIRNTGIHACGVIIAPDDLTKYIPVSVARDSDLWVTQFDNKVVEDAGLLKMDFLGLKTLTIIKDAIELVEVRHGIKIDPDEIPLDDQKTLELYQRGETNGTFQFESQGMQKSLRMLKPTDIEDLIAMNALYRPGPLQFIQNFIDRKQGREEVIYPHELLEPILKDTYGIMVYQEQIMQTAQIIGGFSLGGADILRRAMGKKKMDVMQEMKVVFQKGAKENHDIDEKKANEIFEVMMKFAEYGFNRSHSAAYSVVAFQTAYLKANYPAEFMASLLTNNMGDLSKVTMYMQESKRMGIKVLGPDVNESLGKFTVNDAGAIRFGMNAIKGVGGNAVQAIVEERDENGKFVSIFDLTKRIDLRAANKRTLENLAYAGAFDSFQNVHRAQYFSDVGGGHFLEKAVKFGQNHQESVNSSQVSLFGEGSAVSIPEPVPPFAEKWGTLEALSKEKEVVGLFISGHPLDDFRLEMNSYVTKGFNLSMMERIGQFMGKTFTVGGIVTAARTGISKRNNPYGIFTLQDYHGTYEFIIGGDSFVKFKGYLVENFFLLVTFKVDKFRDEPSAQIQHMELLSEVRDKRAKKLELEIDINDVNDRVIEDLYDTFSAHQGSVKVGLTIIDLQEKIKTETSSRSLSVDLTPEFMEQLETFKEIRYKLA